MNRESGAPDEIAVRMLEAINERDYSQISKLCTENIQLRMPPAQVFFGQDGLREFFHSLERMFPKLTLTADEIYTGDDYAIVEYEAAGETSTGSPNEALGAIVLKLDGGRIRSSHLYVDTAQWERLLQAG